MVAQSQCFIGSLKRHVGFGLKSQLVPSPRREGFFFFVLRRIDKRKCFGGSPKRYIVFWVEVTVVSISTTRSVFFFHPPAD